MAKARITQTTASGFAWEITDLSYAWDLSNYWFAGVTLNSFVSGTSPNITTFGYSPTAGNGIPFGTTNEIASSYPYGWTPSTAPNYPTSPFYVYIWVQERATNLTWSIGASATVPQGQNAEPFLVTPVGTRPGYFYWSSYGTGYEPQNRTMVNGKLSIYRPYATAWNAMRNNIINLLIYKGIISSAGAFSSYANYFPTVMTGNSISAAHYMKVRGCLVDMAKNPRSVIAGVTTLTEDYFWSLKDSMNSIT